MRVLATVLIGLVLSGCVSSGEPPSQPVPAANLGTTQAAPPVAHGGACRECSSHGARVRT